MIVVEDPAVLGELELFLGLGPAELAELNRLLRSSTVQAGTHFITAEQPGTDLRKCKVLWIQREFSLGSCATQGQV